MKFPDFIVSLGIEASLARDCVVLKQAGAFHTSEMADVQCSEDLTVTAVTRIGPRAGTAVKPMRSEISW